MTNPKINVFGDEEWLNAEGQWHRTDGPAYIRSGANEANIWCIDGILYTSSKSYQEVAGLTDEEMTVLILKYGNVGWATISQQ